jgi:hypothetical protein
MYTMDPAQLNNNREASIIKTAPEFEESMK